MKVIKRDQVYQKMIPCEYFYCPECGYIIDDIEIDFNLGEEFKCPSCGMDLKVEEP